jgi:hypothetical protein
LRFIQDETGGFIVDNYVFVRIARIGKFRELRAGQTAPAYEGKNNRVVGNPLIPRELEWIISNPLFSESSMWWVTGLGEVSHQSDSGGEFELHMCSDSSGFTFDCRFDPLNKSMIRVKGSHYDDLDFSYSLPLKQFERLLTFSTLEVFKYIKDNVSMNKGLELRVDEYISRIRE